MATTFTAEDIAALRRAIAQGVKSVSYQDKTVTYHSLDEMIRALRLMEGEVDPESAPNKGVRVFAEFGKGTN